MGLAEDDEATFTAWAQSRQRRLVHSATLLTGDRQRAEDLVQEALLKLALRWSRLRDGNPDAYALTVVFRDNASWWRRRRPIIVEEVPEVAVLAGSHLAEDRLIVLQALDCLTTKQRAVLILRFYDDLSERRTAEILGVGVGTVKSQSAAALARLRAVPELLATLSDEGGHDGRT
jgi:RNA polymerase sigma-70 factor (sigma-E family)